MGRKGVGWDGWWKKLKQDNKNSRVYSSYDVYNPPRVNILLQGLDRRALTVGAISGPHSQIGAILGAISPVVDLHGRQKAL